MVSCEFSEFAYGFAAIREAESELASFFASAGAPKLPSLIEEASLGYDAKVRHVGFALFLQFKRVDFISRMHYSSPTWSKLGSPHYRYSIDTDGHQHQLLLALEGRWAGQAGDVLYASPGFHRSRQFDEAYLRGAVLSE